MKRLAAIIFALCGTLFIGILIGLQIQTTQNEVFPGEYTGIKAINLNVIPIEKITYKNKISPFYENTVQMNMPAVMRDRTGIMTTATLSVKPGEGNIFFNFNNVLISPDTEHSIRNAINVASDVTNISTNNIDFFYTLSDINASMLEGPSAGAAFCIMTISALQNKTINPNVIITGTLNHDGTIGLASGIMEKAIIAKKTGANIFLAPYGLSRELNFTEQEYCSKYGKFDYCQTEYKQYWVDYEEQAGIEIKEIRTIQEAMEEFFAI